MTEEIQFSSVRERIAALKIDQVGRAPGARPSTRDSLPPTAPKAIPQPQPPPRPPRPSAEPRFNSTNNPPLQTHAATAARVVTNQPTGLARPAAPPPYSATAVNGSGSQRPALPARPSQRQASQPPLPPRRPSEQSIVRRSSVESTSSALSERSYASGLSTSTSSVAESHTSRVKAPPFDPSKLPPLPPKRTKTEEQKKRVPLRATYSSPAATRDASATDDAREARSAMPPLPSRPTQVKRDTRALPPPMQSALSYAMNKDTETAPALPVAKPADDRPPPVPLSSRPNVSRLEQKSAYSVAAAVGQESCLMCRDFSGPDTHAARFPRESIPSSDLGWLAHQLTSPFPSATDKARAIFTWLHHNIAYNTKAYFGGNIKAVTPASTFSSGLAVCQGYAELFANLATHAGLECVVISGHGKGYGHTPLAANSPIPPFSTGHAWNAVKIDQGRWKLVDPCWGAGVVSGADKGYVKLFSPGQFTADNVEFGLRHYPADTSHLYREDGRADFSWEEYILADAAHAAPPTVYSCVRAEHGLAERSFLPRTKRIMLCQCSQSLRFQFAKVCPHWDGEKVGVGKPFLFLLCWGEKDGDREYLPFNTDGRSWWCDVQTARLGRPETAINVYAVTSFDGRDGRGLGKEEYLRKKGRVAMGFGGVATWELC